MTIDKIYVILLEHSEEKINSVLERLRMLNLPGTKYEIVKAHDGKKDLLPAGFKPYGGWAIPNSWNSWWKNPISPGELGCSISHINVWKKVIEEGHERVLVLEEDFNVIKPLNLLTEKELTQHEWDFCYLGRYKFEDSPSVQISENLEIPGNSYTSHAYLLTKDGAICLLGSDPSLENTIIPVDEFIPARYMGHRRTDIDSMFKGKMKAIATIKDWISQTSNEHQTTIGYHTVENKFEILNDSNWDAWLEKYIDPTIRSGQWDLIVDEHGDTNIFEFPLFTKKFCTEAVALAESLNKWTVDRHSTYPTNDVLLEDIGLNEIYKRVLQQIVYPLSIHLWKLEGESWNKMYSENFLARYSTDRQSHLALHHDYSAITMVVKLNDEFDGGGTWFPKYKILSNPGRVGTATLHPGLVTHLHGARPITAGKRYICVSFMRKSKDNI